LGHGCLRVQRSRMIPEHLDRRPGATARRALCDAQTSDPVFRRLSRAPSAPRSASDSPGWRGSRAGRAFELAPLCARRGSGDSGREQYRWTIRGSLGTSGGGSPPRRDWTLCSGTRPQQEEEPENPTTDCSPTR
jgi:hypothetical protein